MPTRTDSPCASREPGAGTAFRLIGATLLAVSAGLTAMVVPAATSGVVGDVVLDDSTVGPVAIFAPGTPDEVVRAFYQRFPDHTRYRANSRWTSTAYQPGPLGQGDPLVITWGFAQDGSAIQGAAVGGENPSDTSNAQAFLNGVYGSASARDAVFQQVFGRWQELTGITYVREFNDDGAPMGSGGAAGVVGVRADIRIGGRALDGPSSVLAYNYFPNQGDMVFDTADTFYSGSGLNNNSLGNRNVIAHENGHGIGMSHVCPVNQSKLMEPFVSLSFDGPQLDDILGGQRQYGDPDESNDTAGTATDLGTLGDGATTRDLRSIHGATATDVDYYKFTVPAGKQATVTVTPLGQTYQEGPQSGGSCSPGSAFDALRLIDLGVRLLWTDAVTQLGIGSGNVAGLAETTGSVVLPGAGTYFIHVFGTPVLADIQLYKLDIVVGSGPPVNPTLMMSFAGSGSGSVTSAPSGIACGGSCAASFTTGTTVSLTATPDGGSVFAGFSGDADCGDGIVTMNVDRSCAATFSPAPPPPVPTAGAAGVIDYNAKPMDLNGDGRGDAIDYNSMDGGATIRSDSGSQSAQLEPVQESVGSQGWSAHWTIKPGDFTGDGRTDLFFYNETTGAWVKGISDGSFGFTFAGGSWSPGWSVAVLELNGDGLADVLLYNPITGGWYRGTSLGDGTGAFGYVGGFWSPGWQIHPVRLNADGLTDLFLYDVTTGAWFRAVNDGAGFTFSSGTWSPDWQVNPGDYNGDSLTDLVLYNVTTGAWFVAMNTGSGWTFTGGTFSPGWTVRPGDFNGDGRTDVFLYNVTTGAWVVSIADGVGGWSAHVPGSWSPNWQVFVTSFDLDALADVLLYDASTGAYFQGMNTAPGAFTYVGGNWGGAKDIIATRP